MWKTKQTRNNTIQSLAQWRKEDKKEMDTIIWAVKWSQLLNIPFETMIFSSVLKVDKENEVRFVSFQTCKQKDSPRRF